MSPTEKGILLLLTAMLVTSLLVTIQPTKSQSTTPPVPEFQVTVAEKSFQITLKNVDFNDHNQGVYYKIRYKQPTDPNWAEVIVGYQSSNTGYTTFTYTLDESGLSRDPFGGFTFVDTTVQFQAQRSTYTAVGRSAAPPNNWIFAGSNSSWSSTQTVTFSALPTPTPTPYHSLPPPQTPLPGHESTEEPSQSIFDSRDSGENATGPTLDWVQLVTWTLLSIIIVLLLIVVFYLRKKKC